MRLLFEGLTPSGSKEKVRLDINRKEKRLVVFSSKTNYRPQRLPWTYLFDKGKEEHQDQMTETLNDKEFKAAIMIEMYNKGYTLRE